DCPRTRHQVRRVHPRADRPRRAPRAARRVQHDDPGRRRHRHRDRHRQLGDRRRARRGGRAARPRRRVLLAAQGPVVRPLGLPGLRGRGPRARPVQRLRRPDARCVRRTL
ncbi:MAG: hypothetical protein AVDCRST_MAG85-2333, partial [uncultured Solirubrobacteraceae bacterium]